MFDAIRVAATENGSAAVAMIILVVQERFIHGTAGCSMAMKITYGLQK